MGDSVNTRETPVVAPAASSAKLDAVLKKFLRSIIFYFFIVHFLIANLPRLNKSVCIRFTDIYTRILEIVHELRFPSIQYFSFLFKKIMGFAPNEYRLIN
ncbi:AraC family transcriptional regulator [Bacteroides fragilis]|nr:AraC family transcriptional regulator [Bacteroides fragilis]MBA5646230.1 AraC family transcriptional regulator [Bacteroides fragilis]MBA5656383.1 AraC family transcriptional regulator [Bacteroides fragilis]MBA5673119.1 AraC family transcriptional regulator [Bacteroides fragilis]MCE8799433.1 AraC family transcriptional regulator [Bacteroides fragilis]